jgi:hypothetical protein
MFDEIIQFKITFEKKIQTVLKKVILARTEHCFFFFRLRSANRRR